MPYETPLRNFALAGETSESSTSIVLEQPADSPGGAFRYEVVILGDNMVRVTMGRKDGLGTVEGGLKRKEELSRKALKGLTVSSRSLLSFFFTRGTRGLSTRALSGLRNPP